MTFGFIGVVLLAMFILVLVGRVSVRDAIVVTILLVLLGWAVGFVHFSDLRLDR